jgi:hypothetical protein
MARHKLLTEKEVSEWTGIPEATLKTQRSRPPKSLPPLPFVKLPNGDVRYREDQVNEYIENQTVTPGEARRKRAG